MFYYNTIFRFSLKSDSYESLLHGLIASATPVSTAHSPCSARFRVPRHPHRGGNPDRANVLYIRMLDSKDFATWLQVAKCLRVWDLDARGFHRGMWRMSYRGAQLFVVGVPHSDYA